MTSLPLQGILFDLDDTLLDWSSFSGDWVSFERDHMGRVHAYVQSKGFLSDCSLDHLLQIYSMRVQDAWASARSTLRAPQLSKIIMQTLHGLDVPEGRLTTEECLNAYGWDAVQGVIVFSDVLPMLEKLKAKNIKIGIITNAFHPMTLRDREIKTLGLLDYFPDCRVSAADVGYVKPHPQIFEHALQLLGTQRERTIFIGDNPVADIAGAQSVGMKAILRVKHPAPPMISGLIVPDAAINTMDELPAIIEEWYPGWDQ